MLFAGEVDYEKNLLNRMMATGRSKTTGKTFPTEQLSFVGPIDRTLTRASHTSFNLQN